MIRGVAVASVLPTTASNVPQIVDRAVICSAHDGQPERGHTGSPPSDLVLVVPLCGMWMASWKPCGKELETSKLGLCITASTKQSIIESCSGCSTQRKTHTRLSKVPSTPSTRLAPPPQTSRDVTSIRRVRCGRLPCIGPDPCARPAPQPAHLRSF